MSAKTKTFRRQQILSSLAGMLEKSPLSRVTTAQLAAEAGLSESALYRHFPSKTKIFEGLIEHIEDSLFSRITTIRTETGSAIENCEKILSLILQFSENNPGMSRILSGDALAGETERLHRRVTDMHDKLETVVSDIISEAVLHDGLIPAMQPNTAANLIFSTAEGRIRQFVRSGFKRLPTANWQEQWHFFTNHLLLDNKSL